MTDPASGLRVSAGTRGTTVLLTGAAGHIGATLRAGLPPFGWRLRCLDVKAIADPEPTEEVVTGDLNDPDLLDAAMRDVGAVVHLAAIPTEAPFPRILRANIEATYAVFDAARRAGVDRVLFASSVHASGFTPRVEVLRVDEPARPDGLYGVSKVFGEALGRMYADRYGMRVAALRLGAFQPRPRSLHQLPHWLSPDDAVRLVHACLSAPDLTYAIVYGRSANTRGWTDLGPGRALGYEPKDDSEQYADDVAPEPRDVLLGSDMTGHDFDADAIAVRWRDR